MVHDLVDPVEDLGAHLQARPELCRMLDPVALSASWPIQSSTPNRSHLGSSQARTGSMLAPDLPTDRGIQPSTGVSVSNQPELS